MANKSRNVKQGNIKERKIPIKIQSKPIIEKPAFFETPVFLVILILILTFIAFFPSLKNSFVPTWDDSSFIVDNSIIRHLNFQSIKAIFTSTVLCAYVPLPILSFAIEYHFFGLNPLPYHISNLILHMGCILLVFYFFRLLKTDSIYAAFGALLFGIHPMHVESVAWVTERKDLLYTLFYLCSMILYLLYTQKQNRPWKYFIFSILFFILSLFSKIQAVALPLSLILLDYLLKRPSKSRLVYEKIPFFILSLLFGVAGVLVLKTQGVLQGNEIYSLIHRILFGLYALSSYILKFFAPFNLSALYPLPVSPKQQLLLYYLNPLFLLLLGFLVYRSAHYTRVVVFGILFFFFNILFLLQIVSAGTAFLSDRFTYIPYIGLIFIIAWTLEKIIKKKKNMKYILFPAMFIFIVLFISLTFNRCKTWANGVILWTDVIEKYPNEAFMAYYDRGVEYYKLNQVDKAIDDYTSAIGINPNYKEAYYDRGVVYGSIGQWDKAISDYSRTIEISPNFDSAYSNRGVLYAYLGQWDKAISDCSRAIEIDPNFESAYSNRGNVYGNLKQWDKAISDYSRAIEIDPNYKEAYYNRSSAYGNLGQWERAISDCFKAIGIDPNYKEAYYNLGIAYENMGQWDKAIDNLTRALEIDPNFTAAYNSREIVYKNLKNK
jgi:tetratricopeptide (TPR) repeat protein